MIDGLCVPEQSVAAFLAHSEPRLCPVGDATFPVLTSDPAAGTLAENGGPVRDDRSFHRRRAHPWPYSGVFLLVS